MSEAAMGYLLHPAPSRQGLWSQEPLQEEWEGKFGIQSAAKRAGGTPVSRADWPSAQEAFPPPRFDQRWRGVRRALLVFQILRTARSKSATPASVSTGAILYHQPSPIQQPILVRR